MRGNFWVDCNERDISMILNLINPSFNFNLI